MINPVSEGTPRRLNQVIGAVSAALETKGRLSGGDLASLRRLNPKDYDAPGFWKVMVTVVDSPEKFQAGDPGMDSTERERRWATILQAMAIHAGAFRPAAGFGQALASSDFSELRLQRLLRAEGNRLLDEARIVARFLAAKHQPINWIELADLVLNQRSRRAESLRRKIARDYYSTKER